MRKQFATGFIAGLVTMWWWMSLFAPLDGPKVRHWMPKACICNQHCLCPCKSQMGIEPLDEKHFEQIIKKESADSR